MNRTFDRKFWSIFIPFLLFIFSILFLPYLFTQYYWFNIDFSTTGNVGDTIGGILGPFIGIAAAILTFFAFWVQYKANEQQKLDLKIERFENKFYELLNLHKANVEEARIGDLDGRRTFVHMFYELRFCYMLCDEYVSFVLAKNKKLKRSNINVMNFAYKIFFYGLGVNSEKQYVPYLNNEEKALFVEVKAFIEKAIIEKYEDFFEKNKNAKYYTHGLPVSGVADDKTIEFHYFPFDGHVNKMGHYYRHLYQTASYVVEQKILTEDEKYSYLKTLRAQLSNYEQLLLYYNALAWFDEEWNELFTKYRFIKNISIPLADFDVKPQDKYADERKNFPFALFEWDE